MSNESSTADTEPKFEFVTLQLEQGYETYRAQFSLLLQGITFLVIADVTLIGYAISSQVAGILLVGIIFPLMALRVIRTANRMMVPIAFSMLSLETKYGGGNHDWLANTFLPAAATSEFLEELKEVTAIEDRAERIAQLRRVPAPFLGRKSKTRLAFILIVVAQIIAPFVLWLGSGWRLF